jgi:hypothetical protein
MNSQFNLKELERRAFRSTYQDGLLDLTLGLIVIGMAFYMFRPEEGYGPSNTILFTMSFLLADLVFWVGKWFITIPRMGQVSFGPRRKKRYITLAIILAAVVLVQAAIVLMTATGWGNASLGEKINSLLGGDLKRLPVAVLSSLFVGPPMILITFFIDFPRGYYIAILMALAVFLMVLFNQPIYPLIIGALILAPGVVLFVRFLGKYPLRRDMAKHE